MKFVMILLTPELCRYDERVNVIVGVVSQKYIEKNSITTRPDTVVCIRSTRVKNSEILLSIQGYRRIGTQRSIYI